jgi:apolipoprotein D and lipocalin family protein
MPLPTVQDVDLERFMGDWFVLAHIPASIERKAYNAVESYALRDDGKIATTYVFRKGGFEGPLKEYRPVGTVRDRETNATWDMQFLWPFQAEYLIVELDDDYSVTIIGRSKLDYVWVMARTPEIAPEQWEALEAKLVELGYDLTRLRRVPHQWPDAEHPVQARQDAVARSSADPTAS